VSTVRGEGHSWDFADGSAKAATNAVSHTFANPGTYAVTVTATDATKLSVSASISVNVTPVVPPTPGGSFAAKSAAVVFNFKQADSDELSLMGTLALPTGFSTKSKKATLNFGPWAATAPINGAKSAVSFKFMGPKKAPRGTTPATLSWQVKLNLRSQTLFAALAPLGFTDANVSAAPVSVPVSLVVDGVSYSATLHMTYGAKAGKTGTGVFKK
jgi:PKD repeat protein